MQSWKGIGERVATARGALGLTQEELGNVLQLDRTAVTKIETGRRKLDALELDRVARALHCSLGWLLDPSPLPAVASHRGGQPAQTLVDSRAEVLKRDVESLIALGVLEPPALFTLDGEINDPIGGEQAAYRVREHLGLGGTPVVDLLDLAERLGLYVACESLGVQQPEGCTVALELGGAALLNGSHADGRQRFTMAHEIGHHVLQDAYSVDWSVLGDDAGERVVNAFAIHLLMPRDGIAARWRALAEAGRDARGAAITLAAEFGVSWTAAVAQLDRLGFIAPHERLSASNAHPRRGDYEELGLSLPAPIPCPSVSPRLKVAILAAYRRRKVTAGRAVELLRGTLHEDELPVLTESPLDTLWSDVY